MKTLQTVLFVAYLTLVLILLGGTIFSVMVEYPNWFANIPSSLEATRNFYQVLHPGYFFQTVGPLSLLSGFGFVIAGWRIRPVRNLVLISLGMLIVAELLTFIYIYPRLNILFFGIETHSINALMQAAAEFTLADQIRTGLGVLASALSIAALLRLFRERTETVTA
jgi:signal transduction histidine kinase